jgi:hypothetical protein
MSTVFVVSTTTTCEELSRELAQSIEGGDEYALYEVREGCTAPAWLRESPAGPSERRHKG